MWPTLSGRTNMTSSSPKVVQALAGIISVASLSELLDGAVLFINSQGKIVDFNSGALALLGGDRAAITNSSLET